VAAWHTTLEHLEHPELGLASSRHNGKAALFTVPDKLHLISKNFRVECRAIRTTITGHATESFLIHSDNKLSILYELDTNKPMASYTYRGL
jgi:hypothetical protein